MSMRPKTTRPKTTRPKTTLDTLIRRRRPGRTVVQTLVEREEALADAVIDKERLDWMSDGEDTGTSNIYLVWQCMLSHAPGDLRQVIDHLKKSKKAGKIK